jgi:hypothetical protein
MNRDVGRIGGMFIQSFATRSSYVTPLPASWPCNGVADPPSTLPENQAS